MAGRRPRRPIATTRGEGALRHLTRTGINQTFINMRRQLNLLKPEKKQAVFSWSAQTIDNAGREDTVNGLAQGVDQNQRVGNSVKYTGYWGRLALYFPDSPNIVRIIVYTPKNEGDSMVADGVTVTGVYDMDKYTVYFDKLYSGDGTAGNATRTFTLKKKWKNGKKQQYFGAAAANMTSGRLVIFMVSDSGAIAHPALTGSLRLYWLDV